MSLIRTAPNTAPCLNYKDRKSGRLLTATEVLKVWGTQRAPHWITLSEVRQCRDFQGTEEAATLLRASLYKVFVTRSKSLYWNLGA